MLSKGKRAQTASQALAVLEHRFSSDPKLQYLRADGRFRRLSLAENANGEIIINVASILLRAP